jgi:hypothetical protein
VTGILLVALGVALLTASAVLWALCLRLQSLSALLLAAYVVAWSELVLAALASSAVDRFDRVGLLVCLAAWLPAAYACWRWRGSPRHVALGPRVAWLRSCIRDPLLRVLASVLAVGYAYLIALGLFVAQNDSDPLVYQLTRAALWRQEGHVGIVGSATEPRLDVNPIVAEVGQAATMILQGGDRFVWLGQMAAVAALAVGAFALARRVGLDGHAALAGALLVPSLPLVAMQAPTALNDLVVASFLVAATVFVLGTTRAELLPLALATGLAVGTKFSAPILVPIVVLVGALAQPLRRWLEVGGTVIAGALLGSGWYVVNLERTGEPDGGLSELADQRVQSLGAALSSAQRLVLDSLGQPGTDGSGLSLVVFCGLAIAGAGLVRIGRGRPGGPRLAAAGAAVALALPAFSALTSLLGWCFERFWSARGEERLADAFRGWDVSRLPDGLWTWYGPLATVLSLATLVVVARAVRRRELARPAVALAAAPLLGLLALAAAVAYDPWRGRFLAATWVMAVALFGVVIARSRTTGLIVISVASVTFCLCVVTYLGRPLGLGVSGLDSVSIWQLARWEQQIFPRRASREDQERRVLAATRDRSEETDTIAMSVMWNDYIYPYFGPRLERRVEIVDPNERVSGEAAWLVAAPESSPFGCASSWARAFEDISGWRLYERVRDDACRVPERLTPRDRIR